MVPECQRFFKVSIDNNHTYHIRKYFVGSKCHKEFFKIVQTKIFWKFNAPGSASRHVGTIWRGQLGNQTRDLPRASNFIIHEMQVYLARAFFPSFSQFSQWFINRFTINFAGFPGAVVVSAVYVACSCV